MPQNPQKTKGEILSELESIKDLLIEEDDIPILQEVDLHSEHSLPPKSPTSAPGGTQTSIFDELLDVPTITDLHIDTHTTQSSIPKALGENPFLPQHIRARLHGNNPPPVFDFSATATTKTSGKIETRHDIINEIVKKFLPKIEQELRLKLLTMTEDELKRL